MDQVAEATSEFEKDLDDIGWLKTVEDKTRIPKTVVLVVVSLVSFTVSYVTMGPGLLCNLVGFVYPAYASFKAIETEDGKENDIQWLTYWVIYAIFNIIESFVDVILFWIPFYYSMKFGFLIFLFLPNIRGAQTLYQLIILPSLASSEKRIDETLNALTSDQEGDDQEGDDEEDDKKDK